MASLMLADALNWPLVAAWGIFWFLPLNLLVTGIEALVVRRLLSLRVVDTYRRLFIANVISTIAGGIVYGLQDGLLYAAGLFRSVAVMMHWFPAAAGGMIAIYYAKSVLVEGAAVATKKFSARVGRSRGALLRAVAVANIASYLVVGPVYYFSTRPTFGGIEATDDVRWSANREARVYFIDPATRHLKRMRLEGTDVATLVPFEVRDYVVSGDEGLAAYRGAGNSLYAFAKGWNLPREVWKTKTRFLMRSVAVSPDNRHVAYAESKDDDRMDATWNVSAFDTVGGTTASAASMKCRSFFGPKLTFSSNGRFLILDADMESRYFDASSHWIERSFSAQERPSPAVTIRQTGSGEYSSREDWGVQWPDAERGDIRIVGEPYFGSRLTVRRGQSVILTMGCDYGLLKLGFPHFVKPRFLPAGTEAIVEWADQLYVLDYEKRRIGLVGRAERYALRPTAAAASSARH